jgi:hypothetical protein
LANFVSAGAEQADRFPGSEGIADHDAQLRVQGGCEAHDKGSVLIRLVIANPYLRMIYEKAASADPADLRPAA